MSELTAISLFSGIGGLDHGLEASGFQIGVAVERDVHCVRHLKAVSNRPVIEGDIHRISSRQILERAGLRQGDASALVGGPPCQPFSKSGYWSSGSSRRLKDSRAGTLGAYMRVLRDTLPATYLLENVEGLIYRDMSEGLDFLRKAIDEINRECGVGYSFQVEKLNAAEFGAPQMRERVFIVGHREGTFFEYPAPTHGPPASCVDSNLQPFLTAWDAIGDLQDDDHPELKLRGKWADLLPSIPEGQNYLWHTDRKGGKPLFGWRRRYWNFLLKLSKRRPSWTVPAQPGPATGPFHWKNRRLSQRELCRLQTLPADISVRGPIRQVQKQLGNAVPSVVAEILGLEIRRQLLGHQITCRPTLVPKRRTSIPESESVLPVPSKYLELVGRHEAHPGTGCGFGAELQQRSRSLP